LKEEKERIKIMEKAKQAERLKKKNIPNVGQSETIQLLLSKVIERTYETIMMRVLPSFTQMNTVIEIRKHVLNILIELSNATPEREDKNSQNDQPELIGKKLPPIQNVLNIDDVTSKMLDEFNKRVIREMNRLSSRLPTLPSWTEEEKKLISKQKQKKILNIAQKKMNSKISIAIQNTVNQLKVIQNMINILRIQLKPITSMTKEEEEVTLYLQRKKQLNFWSNEIITKINRKIELWNIHFACNQNTMAEGIKDICTLMSMMILPPINNNDDGDDADENANILLKEEKKKQKLVNNNHFKNMLVVFESCLPILRECWKKKVYRNKHLANCYCRAIYILAHTEDQPSNGITNTIAANNSTLCQMSTKHTFLELIRQKRLQLKTSHLTRLVRRQDLSIGHEVTRLSNDNSCYKRWKQLSSSLMEMTHIIALRVSLIQFNTIPLIIALVQQSDVRLNELSSELSSSFSSKKKAEEDEDIKKIDEDTIIIGEEEEDEEECLPRWEQLLLCKQTCENIAQVIYNLSMEPSTRKWLIGKGILLSLNRLASHYNTMKCLLLVSKTIHLYCVDKNAAFLGVKENIISIIDKIMETSSYLRKIIKIKLKKLKLENDGKDEKYRNEDSALMKDNEEFQKINHIVTKCLVSICSHKILTPCNQILKICTQALEPTCSIDKLKACVTTFRYFTDSDDNELKINFYNQTNLVNAMWSLSLVDDAPIINERMARLLSSISKEINNIEICKQIFFSEQFNRILNHVQERSFTSVSKTCCLHSNIRLKMCKGVIQNEMKSKKVIVYKDTSFLEK
jgi:hypothetical protein